MPLVSALTHFTPFHLNHLPPPLPPPNPFFWIPESCKYTAPHPTNGFNCALDDTCPGCGHCRGWGCFFNYHGPTYYNKQLVNGRTVIPGLLYAQTLADAAMNPKAYGVCANAGASNDFGCA